MHRSHSTSRSDVLLSNDTTEAARGQQSRQWVLTLPWGLRVRAGYDRALCALVVETFVQELQRSYRWRAKRLVGFSSVEDAFTGTVTVIQRFDSALRLNVHLHTLALDGVYVKSDESVARWDALRAPRCVRIASANLCNGPAAAISYDPFPRRIGAEQCITRASRGVGKAVRATAREYRAKPSATAAL